MKLLKISIFLLFISFTSNLKAENGSLFISEKLIETLNRFDINETSNLFIDIQIEESEGFNSFMFLEYLLLNNYNLVEMEQFSDYVITIRVNENFSIKKIGRFPRINVLYKELTFFIQLTRNIDSRILSVENHVFEIRSQNENVIQEKWYTPIIGTFVIGSLVYLLFYGN